MNNKQTHRPGEREILYQLMNYNNNRAILAWISHIRYLDMAIVFYYRKESGNPDSEICFVSEAMRKEWKYTLQELEDLASENTPRMLPVTIQSLEELLTEYLGENALCHPRKEELQIPMHIVTNSQKRFGAAAILYPQVLWAMAELLGEDLYVLPSSIHECILVPASAPCTRKELELIVGDVNSWCVPIREVLSNHAFFYRREDDTLTL